MVKHMYLFTHKDTTLSELCRQLIVVDTKSVEEHFMLCARHGTLREQVDFGQVTRVTACRTRKAS